VEKYRGLGHKQAHLLQFGFSPGIYHPPKDGSPRENAAVFAGGWYESLPLRCKDLADIFGMVLEAGIPLKIYDRYRREGRSSKPFPKIYLPYVHDGVEYAKLGDIYRSAMYAVNVNTVTGSGTMFARRVYEAMACGAIVISNESVGMRKQFGGRAWFANEGFDMGAAEAVRQSNINEVFANHTWERRMKQLFDIIGCE
jgi:hypothetical protein